MKKFYEGVAVFFLLVAMIAVTGCGGKEQPKANEKQASELTVYTSVYNGMVKEMLSLIHI